jgi:glycosyltransferase involved in cell wall biosynthesis
VCVLEDRARDLARFLGDDKRVHTIPNGVELYDLAQRAGIREAQRKRLGIASDELLFVAVGRMVPQKRPFLFLDVAQRIRARIPNAQSLWVGDGTLAAEWDQAVRGRKMEAFVRRAGWQSSVRDFLFAADLFLHTAEFEGLPLAILEALSAGLPCAITPNLLAEMPFLSPVNSIAITDDDSWVPKLEEAETRQEMSVAARRLAEEQFSYDRMAARYETLYRSVTTGACQ